MEENFYVDCYAEDVPEVLQELADTPEMLRLKGVGMHCGVDYAAFPLFTKARGAYSRWQHSLGVANIVWHFTHDLKQAAAGLFHDIATPSFAHTIDFLNKDYLVQESTELGTREMIKNSKKIMDLLEAHQLSLNEVCDYHLYSIADNDTPKLSADRLEYTLGYGYMVHHLSLAEIVGMYQDLFIAANEEGSPELAFQTLEQARKFTRLVLKNGRVFVSKEDRFAMQSLADIIGYGESLGVVTKEDLYTTEPLVIAKLQEHPETAALWQKYRQLAVVTSSKERPEQGYSVQISAKKRYIDPLVLVDGKAVRISQVDEEINRELAEFLALDFSEWLAACSACQEPS